MFTFLAFVVMFGLLALTLFVIDRYKRRELGKRFHVIHFSHINRDS